MVVFGVVVGLFSLQGVKNHFEKDIHLHSNTFSIMQQSPLKLTNTDKSL